MRYPAKGTRGLTRAKVTEEAAVTALRILPAGSQIGTWVFSTDQAGRGVDHRELAVSAGVLDDVTDLDAGQARLQDCADR